MYNCFMVKRNTSTLTKLNAMLRDLGVTTVLTKGHCETYGRQTMAYLRVADMETRLRVERALNAAGVWTNDRYCRLAGNCNADTPNIEVRVSYLKAKGWNE